MEDRIPESTPAGVRGRRRHRRASSPRSLSDERQDEGKRAGRKRRRGRRAVIVLLALLAVLVAVRLMLPGVVARYVNRALDQSPMYEGEIGEVRLHLWRGAYSIADVKILKRTGNIPVPFFAAERVDLALQWEALLEGRLVGRLRLEQPELNFVAAEQEARSQSGTGGPWLQMIRDLFPFRINRTEVYQGSIHFRAPDRTPPVNVYLSELDATLENLTNIRDQVTPLFATVEAHALAMNQAKLECEMKLDPLSYYPTFQIAARLLGLDVRKLNDLARAYGEFDMEQGWFDLVVELNAQQGQLTGYVKPIFRDLQIFSLEDVPEDNLLELFWEALVGVTSQIFRNQPRDQLATVIPLRGDLAQPRADLLATIGNLLRNAFVRAYLPRLQGVLPDIDGLEFGPSESVTEPLAAWSEG